VIVVVYTQEIADAKEINRTSVLTRIFSKRRLPPS
jgi:hypothetical protein